MDAPTKGGDTRVRRPRQKTLLVAIGAVILIAALIAVVVVAIHNNQDDDGGPVQVIPGPNLMPPSFSPPAIVPSLPPPLTASPPVVTPPSTSVPPPAVSNTILMACSDALYRNSCVSSLSSYPGASNANLTGLAGIAVELSLDEGKKASNFIGDLSRKSTIKKDKSALDDCVELLQDTVDQLNNSLSTLRSMDSTSFQDAIGDVQTWVSAAMTNPTTCVDGFQEVNANMIPVVKARTENVTEFMSNALAVINKLSTTGGGNRRLLVDTPRLRRLPYPRRLEGTM